VREIAAVADRVGKAKMTALRGGGERSQLPAYLAKAVPAFEELARHAQQHMAATLPYNRRRAVERLRDGADALAGELAMTGAAFASMWAQTARKWRDVAMERLAELGEEEASGHIHNPFVFGQPIEETETNLFVGRRGVVREIEMSLLGAAQKPALVLWGPRRMGKTSVLLQLPRLLGEEFVAAFVDMQAMQVRESVVAFLRSLSAAAAAGMQRRGLDMEPLDASELEPSPFTTFAGWMERVEHLLGDKRYLLLCLDEFERLERSIRDGKLPEELMDQIRHMIQHHGRVVLLFAGSHRPDEMELNWPDALISTRTIRVSYLGEDEARQLITEPVPGFPVQFGPGAVELVLEVTRCQPYLVQAVCFELVNVLNAAGRRDATVDDVAEAVGLALESTHLYLAEMWRQLSTEQQTLLQRLADYEHGADSERLAEATGLEVSSAESDLRAMARLSIVEVGRETARWRLQIPMVAEWVQRHV
jgi:AAA+ ATPase superfamily predicted ATPase